MIDPKIVQCLIEAANMAPSSRNSQPWAFWTFLDASYIRMLGREVKAWIFHLPVDEPFSSPMRPVLSAMDYEVFYGAPVLILILATSPAPEARDACCLAAENLMLAARSLGVGSSWVGVATNWFELPATKQKLAIPAGYSVIVPIVLGYPDAWPTETHRRVPEVRWCTLPHKHEDA